MRNLKKVVSTLFVSSFLCTINALQRDTSPAATKTVQRKKIHMTPLIYGFPASTLVKIKPGDIPIEQLKKGDEVYTYRFDGYFEYAFVTQIVKRHTDILIKITANGETFFAAPDQPFLAAATKWIAAANLKKGDVLRRTGNALPVDEVKAIQASIDVYCPTVTKYGNFGISAHGFFVGDFNPIIMM